MKEVIDCRNLDQMFSRKLRGPSGLNFRTVSVYFYVNNSPLNLLNNNFIAMYADDTSGMCTGNVIEVLSENVKNVLKLSRLHFESLDLKV